MLQYARPRLADLEERDDEKECQFLDLSHGARTSQVRVRLKGNGMVDVAAGPIATLTSARGKRSASCQGTQIFTELDGTYLCQAMTELHV